jgi:hypothetical protein
LAARFFAALLPSPHSYLRFVVDRDMQIAARDAHVGVPCGISDLGERPTAGVGMIDKRVPLVMNGEPLAPRGP